MSARRTLATVLAGLVLAGACTHGAAAQVLPPQTASQDSMAPAGAPPHWLPADRWVMEHWIPFEESELYRLLGVSHYDVWRWLRDDTRNLAELAFRQGWDPAMLADR